MLRFNRFVLTHVVKQEMGQPPTPNPSLFWQERAGGERRRRRRKGKSRSSIILALVEAGDWARAFMEQQVYTLVSGKLHDSTCRSLVQR